MSTEKLNGISASNSLSEKQCFGKMQPVSALLSGNINLLHLGVYVVKKYIQLHKQFSVFATYFAFADLLLVLPFLTSPTYICYGFATHLFSQLSCFEFNL